MLYELWIITAIICIITGKIKKISLPEFHMPILLLLPFVLQISAMLMHSYMNASELLFLSLVNLSYLLLIIALWQNRHIPGFLVFLIGTIGNALVIWFNEGRMPVSIEALRMAGLDNYIPLLKEGVTKHQLMDEQTNLSFLGDIIPLNRPYAEHQIISIGDVVQSIGITLLVWNTLGGLSILGRRGKKKINIQ
jgi:hypothetical protein